MIKSELQSAVGNNIIIASVSGVVKWRFADKDANKAYGLRTYKPVKNQSVSSVASEIRAAASRL